MLRELRTLKREIDAYPDDASIWRTLPTIPNTAGTLALHMAGNLRHFIGAVLGGTGYVRDRDAEFARRDVPRATLHAEIDAAMRDVEAALGRLTEADLAREFPLEIAKARLNTGDFLFHLATHLSYHLGQVDYHRRAVAGSGASVGAVSPTQTSTATPVAG
jgi:uncharacterized damage-inducible protein DinB